MKFKEQIERLKKLNNLIASENTGCPNELANKSGIKRSTLYETLEYLKSTGLDISYDRRNRTFYYSSNSTLEIHFSLKVLNNSELNQYNGGFQNSSFPSILYRRSENILAT